MALTVASLCELTDPVMMPVAGLRGVGNKVSWVVSTEYLEPRNWLRGGEFMLMCGWNFRPSGAMMERYIEHLYRGGLAGLGFGVGIRFKEIPDAILRKADKLGFPVCLVPYELGFEAISRRAVEVIFSERQARFSVDGFLRSRTIEDTLEDRIDLNDIATRLANTLVCDTAFVARPEGIIARAVGRPPDDQARGRPENAKVERLCTPSVTLEIHCDETSLGPADNAFIDEMTMAARIHLYKLEAVKRERLRLASDLLHDLSNGALPQDQIASKLSAFGFDPGGRFHVMVVRDSSDFDAMIGRVERLLADFGVVHLKSKQKAALELLIGRSDKIACDALAAKIANARSTTAVGLSRPSTAAQLVQAVKQAHYLSQISSRGVFLPESLGIEELILTIDIQAAAGFVRRHLGGDVDPELLAAIDVYMGCGFNINLAARKLGIHRHTLRNRLERFAQLTKCDIRDSAQRQNIWMAIKLVRNLNIKEAGVVAALPAPGTKRVKEAR